MARGAGSQAVRQQEGETSRLHGGRSDQERALMVTQ